MLCSGLDWGRKGGKARGGDKFLTRPEIRVKKAGPHFLRTPRKKMFGTRSYIIVTFAFLFWLYYVASGGGAFEPEQWPEVPVARVQPAPVPEPEPEPVIAEEIAPAAVEPAPAADGAAILDALTEAAPAETVPLPDLSGAGLENAFSFTEPVAPIGIAPEAIVAAPEPAAEPVRIAGSRVNIRSGPGTENGVVTTLDGGVVVEVLSRAENGWVEIRLPDDLGTGWVSGTLVEPAAE
jgi:hypothetical protein